MDNKSLFDEWQLPDKEVRALYKKYEDRGVEAIERIARGMRSSVVLGTSLSFGLMLIFTWVGIKIYDKTLGERVPYFMIFMAFVMFLALARNLYEVIAPYNRIEKLLKSSLPHEVAYYTTQRALTSKVSFWIIMAFYFIIYLAIVWWFVVQIQSHIPTHDTSVITSFLS